MNATCAEVAINLRGQNPLIGNVRPAEFARLVEQERFGYGQSGIDDRAARRKLVEIGFHLGRFQVDTRAVLARTEEALKPVRLADDAFRHRLHHDEVDVRDLVIACTNRFKRPQACRDVAMHAQALAMSLVRNRLEQGCIERSIEFDGGKPILLCAVNGLQRFIAVAHRDRQL